MIKRLLLIALVLVSIQVNAEYDISIVSSPSYKDKSVITLVDNCKKTFQLLINNSELKTGKALKWLDKLIENNLLDTCVK